MRGLHEQNNTEVAKARPCLQEGTVSRRLSFTQPFIHSFIHSGSKHSLSIFWGPAPCHMLGVWKSVRTSCQNRISNRKRLPTPKASLFKVDFPGLSLRPPIFL